MTRRTQQFAITAAANAQTLAAAMTTPTGRTRKIVAMSSNSVAGLIVRGYLEQDMIVDFASVVPAQSALGVPVYVEVPAGASFTPGYLNTTGAPIAGVLNVVYEEEG